ncbi:MAG: DUF938 domain-containing protein [Pseudomonadota bacterium]
MTCPALPPNVSCATTGQDGRMYAPAAERNAEALLDVMRRHAPQDGRALELASGTGQHVAQFARALPGLTWQPSDMDAERLGSIEAWRRTSACDNMHPAIMLDATAPGWGARHGGQALVLVINLLHLITKAQAQTLVSEAATALAPEGRLMIYGPFLRQGQPVSAGDRAFDAQLRTLDPDIGYKSDNDIEQQMKEAGFDHVDCIEMPANNLVFLAQMG